MRTSKTQRSSTTEDWREDLISDLAEPRIRVNAHTFPTAYEQIKVAAYNRRMPVEEFIGRAALAFAVHDSEGELGWGLITRREPPIRDLRRKGLEPKRYRGKNFGKWKIGELK